MVITETYFGYRQVVLFLHYSNKIYICFKQNINIQSCISFIGKTVFLIVKIIQVSAGAGVATANWHWHGMVSIRGCWRLLDQLVMINSMIIHSRDYCKYHGLITFHQISLLYKITLMWKIIHLRWYHSITDENHWQIISWVTKWLWFIVSHRSTFFYVSQHWNENIVRVKALIFTGDVEDKLQHLQWIPGLSPWLPFCSYEYTVHSQNEPYHALLFFCCAFAHFFPCSSGLLHWHCHICMIAAVPVE